MRKINLPGPAGASVDISTQGAQVLSWRDATGKERIFLSPSAALAPGQAIRGGVPVIFPQFSCRGAMQKHGFARLLVWSADPAEVLADGRAHQSFSLKSCDATRKYWPYDFEALVNITLGATDLEMRLRVINTGKMPFAFTAALHSYFAANLSDAQLLGLAGRPYEDSAAGGSWRVQEEGAVTFGSELDRIYPAVGEELTLISDGQRLRIASEGFRDIVVWNPGPTLAAALPDLGFGQHMHFVCIEAAHVLSPIVLAPGESWCGAQLLYA